MAKLPEIQQRGAVTRGPQSSVSSAEIANPYQQIANALSMTGQAFEKQEVTEAQNDGQNAVYRDDAGNLKVDTRSNFSAAGRSYNAAAQQGYAARLAGDIRARGTALTTESKGNIESFNASWKAFRDQTLTSVPKDFRGAVTTMLDTEGPRFAMGVSEQKRTTDLKEFEGNVKAEIQLLDDDMSALARGGGTGTSAYKEKQAQARTLYGQLAENPDFTVGKQEADIAVKRMESRHMSEAMLGTVDRALQTGGIAEARKIAERMSTDTSLALSPAERRQYAGLAGERINGFVAQTKANLKPVQDQSTVIQKRLKEGVGLDLDDIDTTARQLAAGGDMSGAMELYSARAMARTLQGFKSSDNAAQVGMAEGAIKGANAGTGIVGKIVGVESGGNDAAQNPNSSAGGAGQFIDSTWLNMVKKYRPDVAAGKSSSELIALKKDGALSREMTGKYAEENASFLRNQGVAATDGNVYLAHFLGPRGAAQILKADPNASVASIVGQDAVNANKFLAGKTASDLRAWADKKMGGASSQSINPELIKEYRSEVTSDAKQLFTDIKAGYDKNLTPAVADINLLSRQLAVVDDQDLRREVADYFTAQSGIAQTAGMQPAQVESLVSSLRADAADGATAAQAQIISGIEAQEKARTQALKDDPIGFGVRQGMISAPPPLDLSQPDTWAGTFSALQNGADVMKARGQVGTISALRPEMQAQVSRVLTSAPPQEAVQLLGSMAANLSPDTYSATMAALYSSGQSRAAAAAGALVPNNPEAAEGVLRGQQLLKENPLLAPKRNDDNTVAINDILPPSVFAPTLEGARQGLLDAATARYADLSAQAGDTSGELNADRMEQSVKEITGGILEFNGSQIVAPRYGMSQDDFDKTVEAISDQDISAAMTSAGTSVRADDFRDQGRLRAVADGRYLLEFGSAESPSYALRRPSPGSYGQPSVFVLDLRGR
jgi:hypothetical protein